MKILILSIVVFLVSTKIYFHETFDDTWSERWVQSTAEEDSFYGKLEHTAGDYYGDAELDKGIKTSEDARHFVVAAYFDEDFDGTDKDLVIQYSLKQTHKSPDCGGSYLKIGPREELPDLKKFKDDTNYGVMFGPDQCGSEKKIHLIFNYNGNNLLWKKKPQPETGRQTHIYTAIVKPDNTYELLVDGEPKESGKLEADWDFLPPKEIPDPESKKPEDWVDDAKIPDPEDEKPVDWDEEPKFIADPEAEMPEDWEEDEDGAWEPPQIPNPAYKGEWTPKMIDNPDYKGPWEAPKIANPDYEPDENLYLQKLGFVGIEIWQVKTGSIFDNILITDDVEEAKAEREKILERVKKEKEMLDEIVKVEAQKEEEERKKREEERAAREEEEKKKREEEEAERILKEAEETIDEEEKEEEAPKDEL